MSRKGLGWRAAVVQDLQVAAGREQVLLVWAQALDLRLEARSTSLRGRRNRPGKVILNLR